MICTLYSIIINVIKSRLIRWAGHVAHLERKEECRQEFSGKPEEKRHLEYLGVN